MCEIFWPKFSICDLICHMYILFEPVYDILHNKIHIWTFDSDNRIGLLREFNYVLGFFRQTDPTLYSNSFIKSFQHLTSWKIVPCLQCMWFHTWHIGIAYKFLYRLSHSSEILAVYVPSRSSMASCHWLSGLKKYLFLGPFSTTQWKYNRPIPEAELIFLTIWRP